MKIPYVLSCFTGNKGKTEYTLKPSKKINDDAHEKGKRLPMYNCIELQDMMYDMEKKFMPNLLDDIEVI